jgi:molybdopterin molybdotransferase
MSEMMELDDAVACVVAAAARVRPGHEAVALDEALFRTLAVDVRSTEPWPPTDRSAMDGFAVAAAGEIAAGARFTVVGESLAGRPFERALKPGEAVRIMTGAVVPDGARAVVRVEDTSGFGTAAARSGSVDVTTAVADRSNIRPLGSELAANAIVLRAGTRLRAAQIGVLAVLGHTTVPVVTRPKVAIVSTGDEVVAADQVPAPHQVRDSNSWSLAAQCEELGAEAIRLGIAPDEGSALREVLARGLEYDVLLTIGGVSAGTHDLVQPTLAALGVRTLFHGVRLKPGKPTFFGLAQRGERVTFVFGLPGNPASAFTTCDLFVAQLLAAWFGRRIRRSRLPLGGVAPRVDPRTQAIVAGWSSVGEEPPRLALERLRPSGDPFALTRGAWHAIVPAGSAPAVGSQIEAQAFSDPGENPCA